MSGVRHFQRIMCAGLLIAIVAGGFFEPVAAKTDVFELVPAQSLAVVRVNRFDTTLGQVDKFLAGLAPMPVQTMVRGKLGEALGSAEVQGVDMNGDFAAFIVAGQAQAGGMPPIYPGVLIPISNYDQFVQGNPNCGKPDENGVSAIRGPGHSNGGAPWLIATKAGSHALVTMGKLYPQVLQYQEAVETGITPLTARLDAAAAKAARQEPVWVYGNVARASSIFKPILEGKFEQFKTMVTQQVEEGSPTGPMVDMGLVFDFYGALLEMLMDQTQSLSLSVDPQPDVLRITETISAVPGSDLAAMLAKDYTGQPNRLIGFAADGAAVSFAGTIGDSWKAMYTELLDLASVLMGDSMTPEAATQMKAMTANMIDALEGPAAGAMTIDGSKRPIFGVTYAFAAKDAEKFSALMKESTELFNEGGFGDLYKGMGIEMDYAIGNDVDSYKGVSIDKARLSLKSTQPDSPVGKFIAGAYGGGFDYRWAIVDKTCVMAMGADVDVQIRQLIDQIKDGTHKKMGSDMKAAFAALPGADKADFVLNYNYVRFLNIVGAVMQIMGEEGPDINVPTSSHISIAGWGGENQARIAIAVPKQHIMEIVGAFTQLGQMHKQTEQ